MREKYERARRRFWIWLYRQAQRRLPEDWYDEVWAVFIQQRIAELQSRALPDEYIELLLSEARAGVPWELGREYRPAVREIRDER